MKINIVSVNDGQSISVFVIVIVNEISLQDTRSYPVCYHVKFGSSAIREYASIERNPLGSASLKGFPLELGTGARGQKNLNDAATGPVPGRERSLTMSLAVWMQ